MVDPGPENGVFLVGWAEHRKTDHGLAWWTCLGPVCVALLPLPGVADLGPGIVVPWHDDGRFAGIVGGNDKNCGYAVVRVVSFDEQAQGKRRERDQPPSVLSPIGKKGAAVGVERFQFRGQCGPDGNRVEFSLRDQDVPQIDLIGRRWVMWNLLFRLAHEFRIERDYRLPCHGARPSQPQVPFSPSRRLSVYQFVYTTKGNP